MGASNIEQTYTIDEIKEIIEKLDISKDEKTDLVNKFLNKTIEKKREQIYKENAELIDLILDYQVEYIRNTFTYYVGPIGFFVQMIVSKEELIDKIDKVKKITGYDASDIISPNNKIPLTEKQRSKYIFPLYKMDNMTPLFICTQRDLLVKYLIIWNE